MKRLARKIRQTTQTAGTTGLRPQIGRPVRTVEVMKRDYDLLKTRGYTEFLAPKYFKKLELGAVVRIEPLFNTDHREFRLARLQPHPKNHYKRVYSRHPKRKN